MCGHLTKVYKASSGIFDWSSHMAAILDFTNISEKVWKSSSSKLRGCLSWTFAQLLTLMTTIYFVNVKSIAWQTWPLCPIAFISFNYAHITFWGNYWWQTTVLYWILVSRSLKYIVIFWGIFDWPLTWFSWEPYYLCMCTISALRNAYSWCFMGQ